jgi:hypothetical protein
VQYSGDLTFLEPRNPDLRLCKHQLQTPKLLYSNPLRFVLLSRRSPLPTPGEVRAVKDLEVLVIALEALSADMICSLLTTPTTDMRSDLAAGSTVRGERRHSLYVDSP